MDKIYRGVRVSEDKRRTTVKEGVYRGVKYKSTTEESSKPKQGVYRGVNGMADPKKGTGKKPKGSADVCILMRILKIQSVLSLLLSKMLEILFVR